MDINVTILSGIIVTTPSWFPLLNNKRALVFTIKNQEVYRLSDGRVAKHANHVTVEILGKLAERYFEELQYGKQYVVTGYLRVDEIKGADRTRIRAFRVDEVLSGDR